MNTPADPNVGISFGELAAALPQTNYGEQESWSNGKYRFEMLPAGYIALNRELATGLHPKLEASLSQQDVNEVDIRLSAIALYCGVLLDATYTIAERDKLCFILAGRLEVLREMPTGLIVQ
jgi:hypothetical protein